MRNADGWRVRGSSRTAAQAPHRRPDHVVGQGPASLLGNFNFSANVGHHAGQLLRSGARPPPPQSSTIVSFPAR